MKITKPTFVVDLTKCSDNIKKMAAKAAKRNVDFRPHFKTHQSEKVADLYKQAGISKITVSSVEMAEQFASMGWKDITIAFPVNILEIDAINQLTEKIKLNLVLESLETCDYLNSHITSNVFIYLKIDTGYHRTGIAYNNHDLISELLNNIQQSKHLKIEGLLSHAGHTYQAKNTEEVKKIHKQTVKRLQETKAKTSHKELKISIGDTPSCSLVDDFTGVDEIRPGNFVYYDAMQMEIGSCQLEQIGAVVACPVVAIHKDRNEIVIYGGGVHFSKESISNTEYGKYFGRAVDTHENKWGNLLQGIYLKKLSQEHGILHADNSIIEQTNIGDILMIVPAHSCLSANLLKTNTLYVP